MRGLTARELECLTVCAGPDICVADGSGCLEEMGLGRESDELVRRGLLFTKPCPFKGCENHVYPTPDGRLLLGLGGAAVTGGAS